MHTFVIEALSQNASFSFLYNATANSVIRIKFANANYDNGNYKSNCIFKCTCLHLKIWYAITNKLLNIWENMHI